MKNLKLIHLLLFAICTSILLSFIYQYTIKKTLKDDFLGIMFVVDSNIEFRTDLYYSYGNDFNEAYKVEDILDKKKDTLLFFVPDSSKMIKRFRIDIFDNKKLNRLIIKEMSFLFKSDTITLKGQEVFKSFFLSSSSILLSNDDNVIRFKQDIIPYDPYIIFKPILVSIIESNKYYILFLLLPFIILPIYYARSIWQYKLDFPLVLVTIFIICIPLKEAWTTFSTLLLFAYSLFLLLKRKKTINGLGVELLFVFVFFIPILLGRPDSLRTVDISFGLLLFCVIGKFILDKPLVQYYKVYVFTIMIIMTIMIASGINFLISFFDLYHLDVLEYFVNIKIYNGHIKTWLYYNHSTFLSFFALIGLLFVHEMMKNKVLQKDVFYLYEILLFFFFLFLGSRIMFFLFFLFNFNFLFRSVGNKIIIFNAVLFVSMAIIFLYNLNWIDENRYHLWNVSWEAIKDKPFFGHGLGNSNEILHDMNYVKQAGFSKSLGFNHSHNQFITFVLEIGGIGTLFIFMSIYYLINKKVIRLSFNVTLFLFGVLYLSLTESILETSKSLYVISFLFLMIYKYREA